MNIRTIRAIRPGRRDRGAISTFVAITAASLVILLGIVLDLGGRLRVMEQTDALAQEAARAAGQQLDRRALLEGRYQVLPAEAQAAADAYLRPYNLTAHVEFPDPGTVVVRIDSEYHTKLLSLIRIDTLPVHGTGKAVLVHGVTEAENG
ncbi:hypothetical protein AB0K43_01450 [Kitasatospora sp. NPDC049258]|uniref:hypothetical protein n=1 Tax=Kitasatospora sp. NPDC049258 TaxID=3155394 RepID=UPI0034387FD6